MDVSAYQGNIDWKKVKASGIDFAIIRLGYRGYGKAGKLVEDEYAKANLKGATEAGLPIGAYFFSQAVSVEEARQEAQFVLEMAKDMEFDMPIVFDWEYLSDTARTADVDARTLTDCAIAFCETIEAAGYTPMVYFNIQQARTRMYLEELLEYKFWLALYDSSMTYQYKIDMWQYTCTGSVPGISGNVDINVYLQYD